MNKAPEVIVDGGTVINTRRVQIAFGTRNLQGVGDGAEMGGPDDNSVAEEENGIASDIGGSVAV